MNKTIMKTTIVTVLCYDPIRRAVLLVEQDKPGVSRHWALPGGTWEPYETAEEAAVREMLEETGLSVRSLRLYDSRVEVVETESGPVGVYILTYEARCADGEPIPHDPDAQVVRAVWVPVESIPHLTFAHPGQQAVIQRYLKERAWSMVPKTSPSQEEDA